jgi:basic membrane lipoprotein Med (substrate-binding protein (PBP1-ABC) superfamily)
LTKRCANPAEFLERAASYTSVMSKTWIVAGVALLGIFAGCNNNPAPVAGTTGTSGVVTDPPEKPPIKVALLTPGPVSDAGWSALAYDALKKIKETGAEVNNQEATGPKIKDAMRTYAQDGYKLVIGHGYEYNSVAVDVAKDFPDTVFVSSSGDKFSKNAGAIRFLLEEGFYMAGFMAANVSKTQVVAMVGLNKIPSIKSTFNGFRAGAMAVNPKIKILEISIDDPNDVAKAKQATLTAIGQGADVVIHQANAAAQGVFEACKEKKVWAIGANFNQNDNESGVVVASAIIKADTTFLSLAEEVRNGTYEGGVKMRTMKDDAIEFVPNPAHVDLIPQPLAAKLEQLAEDIKSGKVVVPYDKF